jgi:phosphoribosylaminoimidazole-succinocarboxamide synthase
MAQFLHETALSFGLRQQGKVRDIYALPGATVIVATDRHSVFDRAVPDIAGKGQVLNRLSAFWFERTADIVPNHVLAVPDPNAMLVRPCTPVAIEAVMRGFITGTTATSIWRHYQEGRRDFGGVRLGEGMRKNQKLDTALFTPSTKEREHDKTVSVAEAVSLGLVSADLIAQIERVSGALFARGQAEYLAHGLILADTKYEFGIDDAGQLRLIDEIHTPDSSRLWDAASYEERLACGEEPNGFDKEQLRLWYARHCDPYRDAVLPNPPAALLDETAGRYAQLFRRVTGEELESPPKDFPIEERILRNLRKALAATRLSRSRVGGAGTADR